MKTYHAIFVKAQKEKETVEGQFAVLESEKVALNKALKEAKVARDKVIAITTFLKFEQERLVRVAKEEVEEKVAKAISEKEEVIKAFEEEKVDQKTVEEMIRVEAKEEVVGDILKFKMSNKRSTLFMIKKKYPDMDLADVDLTQMESYNISNPADGSEPIGDLDVRGAS